VLDGGRPTVDVYRAADITAAGILAAASADDGSEPREVPDFRPGPSRDRGAAPVVRP
jgi:hypothetical protein